MLTAMNSSGRGWHKVSLKTGASAENVSIIVTKRFRRKKPFFCFFFWTSRFEVLQGMLCTKLKFRANIRRTDCVGSMLSHVSRPESNLDWNQVTSRRSGDFCTLMSTPFLRDRRWILHTCLMAGPLPSPLLFIYFSPETWDPLRPKKKKRKIKKNTHTHTHISGEESNKKYGSAREH